MRLLVLLLAANGPDLMCAGSESSLRWPSAAPWPDGANWYFVTLVAGWAIRCCTDGELGPDFSPEDPPWAPAWLILTAGFRPSLHGLAETGVANTGPDRSLLSDSQYPLSEGV